MKAGILLPVFNAARYVEEALQSAIKQTHRDTMIYTRDDASTDESIQITNRYGLKYSEKITLVDQHENENLGWAANHNRLAQKAIKEGCETIFMFNADDMMTGMLIEKMAKEIELGYDFVCCQGTIFHKTGDNHTRIIGSHKPKSFCEWQEFKHYNHLTSFAMFKSSVWESMGGYDTSVNGYEDWELWIRLLKAGYKYKVIEQPLYWYRDHAAQTSKGVNKQHCIDYIHKKHFNS